MHQSVRFGFVSLSSTSPSVISTRHIHAGSHGIMLEFDLPPFHTGRRSLRDACTICIVTLIRISRNDFYSTSKSCCISTPMAYIRISRRFGDDFGICNFSSLWSSSFGHAAYDFRHAGIDTSRRYPLFACICATLGGYRRPTTMVQRQKGNGISHHGFLFAWNGFTCSGACIYHDRLFPLLVDTAIAF